MSLFCIVIRELEEIESMVTDPSPGSSFRLDWLFMVQGSHHISTPKFSVWAAPFFVFKQLLLSH